MSYREQWDSDSGFILAALGSAVGLGNVWRFSYLAGENGGAAFLVVYLVCVAAIGLPLMLAELAIGRTAQLEATGAFARLGGAPRWRLAGVPSVIGAFIVLAYYPVIAGWALRFFVEYLAGGPGTLSGEAAERHFLAFIGSATPMFWQASIVLASLLIVRGGVGHGIEAANRFLMPLLALLLCTLAAYTLSLPGSWAGVSFVFAPDWSALGEPGVWLAALGQAFFSLSLAMGALLIYGSYVPSSRRLPLPALAIAIGDTVFSMVAGLMIFPAVFAFGLDPASGPTLAFITMPRVFAQMPGGIAVGAAFFGLLVVAAITSTISLLEVIAAFLMENLGMTRPRASLLASVAGFLAGVPAALSFGVLAQVRLWGLGVLDAMDRFVSNLLLPLNGILIALFVGWIWHAAEARRESGLRPRLAACWHWSIRWLAPCLIALILLHSLGLLGAAG